MNMTKEAPVDVEARRLIVTLGERYEPQRAVFLGHEYERVEGEGVGDFLSRIFAAWPPELEWIALSMQRGEEVRP